MLLQRARPILRKVAVAGGAATIGIIAFPSIEDSYWAKKDPQRVYDGDKSPLIKEQNKDYRKKLTLLGTGWASISALQHIDRDKYNVTVVSPRNYFLFTPLLPSLCAGTVTSDAITIPIREFTSYKNESYLQRLKYMWRGYLPNRVEYVYAAATSIDQDKNEVSCDQNGNTFTLPYDFLVLGTGAATNTFNTTGVAEHSCFLKETGDAVLIRQAVLKNLEKASLPLTSPEERKKLLSFFVVGGGPTAVEFAAELKDFLHHDVVNPKHATYHRCAGETQITLVQSNEDLLPGYPKKIRDFALSNLRDMDVTVQTQARATKLTDKTISIYDKQNKETLEHPYGLVVWATGVSPGAIIKKLMKQIPEQEFFRSLKTDHKCRVLGTKDIYAIGDCADIDTEAEFLTKIVRVFDEVKMQFDSADKKKNKKGKPTPGLSLEAYEVFLDQIQRLLKGEVHAPGGKFSQELKKRFEEAKEKAPQNSQVEVLTKEDVVAILKKHMERQKVLPPTAQVAHQQGAYLAKLLNNPKIDEKTNTWTFEHGDIFQYQNLGQLVYVGGHMAALSIPTRAHTKSGDDIEVSWNGNLTNYIWHAAYFGMLESMSSRCELLFDWLKRGFFGRSTALDTICSTDDTKKYEVLRHSKGDSSTSTVWKRCLKFLKVE